MTRDDERWPDDWHNNQQVAIAGGIAAVLLLGILVYAVFRVSDDSVTPPPMPVYPTTSSATTSTTLKTDTSTTEYPRTSVQTSEPALAPVGPPPTEAPPTNEPPTENTWSPTNPYATTTQERAGSI